MSLALLRRKLWFYGTIARLTILSFIALGAFTALAIFAIFSFRDGDYYHAGIVAAVALSGAFLIFAAAVIVRHNIRLGIRRELRKRNCCPYCSYDLRATALRCPECGRPLRTANIEI